MSVLDSIKNVFSSNKMAEITLSAIPGEAALVALANLITVAMEGQSAEEKAKLWQRYLELTDPWHQIVVAISSDAAGFVTKILKLNPQPPK